MWSLWDLQASPYDKLIKGHMRCKCGKGFNWSKSDRCTQVEEIIHSSRSLSHYILERYVTTLDSRLRVTCVFHGDFTCTINNFINHGSRCPKCTSSYVIRGREEDEDFLYLLYNKDLKLYKVGRSFQPERRLKIVNKELGGWEIIDLVSMSHESVCKMERLILEGTHDLLPKECPRFRGYTEVRDFKYLKGKISLMNLQKTVSGKLKYNNNNL